MTQTFKPQLDVLPPGQRRLWTDLSGAKGLGFVLYRGTAIALRLGHRQPVDFDFFSDKSLDRRAIAASFPFVAQSTTIQDQDNSWSILRPYGDSERDHVKISFFGSIGFDRVSEPELTDDGILQVASVADLLATKVDFILQRAEAKDYRDIAAMVQADASLPRARAGARLMFGQNFQPGGSLKALVYCEDGDLNSLSQAEKSILVEAARSVRDLPEVELSSNVLASNCIAQEGLRRRDQSGAG